jgi:hypothetical protein
MEVSNLTKVHFGTVQSGAYIDDGTKNIKEQELTMFSVSCSIIMTPSILEF